MGDVDDLAARGKANAEAKQREIEEDQARKARAEQLDRHRQRWAALSAWGMFTFSFEESFVQIFFLLFVPLTVANILILVKLRVSDAVAMMIMPGHGRLYLPIPAVLLCVGAIVHARRAVRQAVVREAAMLAALPFRVTGYLECLGSYHRDNENDMTLEFDFEGDPPPQLRDILASDGGTWKVTGHRATRDPGPRTNWATSNNRHVVRWFHALIREQLLPLHREHPFRSVRVTNSEGEVVDQV